MILLHEILVCPCCRGRVALRTGGGAYLCAACRLSYPVRDGIPVMLVDEAAELVPEEAGIQP
jgi:uncharacterized protein YbaR (Trm112 family)